MCAIDISTISWNSILQYWIWTYFLVEIRNNTVDYMKLEIVNGLYYSEKIKLKLRLWNTQKIN